MQIFFGESLRRLRKAKGLTQEALAARLGVAFQTVSKWERDESYPDLTMLPTLAAFFGVTADELLAVNTAENERRVAGVIEAYDNHKPDTAKEHLPVLKAALGEFPLDYRLWVRYLEARLYCIRGLKEAKAAAKEIREIYENIDAHCTNDRIRIWAKRLFVMHLHSLAQPLEPGGPLGEPALQAEAEHILSEMPDLRACRDHVAVMVSLPGEAHLRACQQELVSLVWMMDHALFHHDVYGRAHPGEEATHARAKEIIWAQEWTLRLMEMMFPDGDYGKLAIRMIYTYGYLAFYRAVLGEYDAAFGALGQSVALAAAFDAQPQVVVHTSPLVEGLPYDKSPHDRGMSTRVRDLFGARYPWPDSFRNDPRFMGILYNE